LAWRCKAKLLDAEGESLAGAQFGKCPFEVVPRSQTRRV
jgi:hypothetical protein